MFAITLSAGRGWLDAPAAAALERLDARLGRRTDINSAGRTRAEQQALWDRYARGDRSIGRPAVPGTSPHESGAAIDTDDRTSLLGEYGFVGGTVKGEPWHYVYRIGNDRHLPTLRRGSKGTAVKAVQSRVGVAVDGDFGPKTEAAVKAAQRAHGITADGIVGPVTHGKIGA